VPTLLSAEDTGATSGAATATPPPTFTPIQVWVRVLPQQPCCMRHALCRRLFCDACNEWCYIVPRVLLCSTNSLPRLQMAATLWWCSAAPRPPSSPA
jgi:hypothetical protein